MLSPQLGRKVSETARLRPSSLTPSERIDRTDSPCALGLFVCLTIVSVWLRVTLRSKEVPDDEPPAQQPMPAGHGQAVELAQLHLLVPEAPGIGQTQ